MDKQLEQCPVILSKEYDQCYFLVHRAYSHFFGNMYDNSNPFGEKNFSKILDYLFSSYIKKEKYKNLLFNIFEILLNCKDNNSFIENSIRAYTSENCFCYLFNKSMRNFEPGLMLIAYYMGPLLFGLNKYVKDNPSFAFSKDMTLYRKIKCPKIDFYLYELNLNHIICFPSITSTSSQPKNFEPSKLANNINKINEKNMELIKIKLIFNYKHDDENKSPGIIVEDKKGHDGTYLSRFPKEKEVILFPFTFVKIINIESAIENGNNIKVIYFDIINRKNFLEYTLRDNFKARFLFRTLEEDCFDNSY